MAFDLSPELNGWLTFAGPVGSLQSFSPLDSDSAESTTKEAPGVRLPPKRPSPRRGPSHAKKRQLPGRRSSSHSDCYAAPASALNVKLVIVIKGKTEAYPSSLCTTTYVRLGDSFGGSEI